jgi:hypothetical protein
MRRILTLTMCLALTACAAVEPYPTARPLSQSSIETMGPTRVSVIGDDSGVAKSWYYTDVNGAGAGI